MTQVCLRYPAADALFRRAIVLKEDPCDGSLEPWQLDAKLAVV
jgi:hypothetical protein